MENVDYFKRVIVVPFMLFSMIMAYSQSISVSSFKLLDSDLTANTAGTMEQDQNGEVAALIKVVTTQTGFTFDCGAMGIVKTKQTPGEIWVYVPRGSKKITIKHPQLGVLRDYYYPVAINAARTYEMVLFSGTIQTIVKQARTTQFVVFKLSPVNAQVELDGTILETIDGIATKLMKMGTYDYRVRAPNYLPEAGKVTIDDSKNKKFVDIVLKPNFSKVTVKVGDNAEIWVNGEKKGNGSWTGDLSKGTYEFEAKKEGCRSTIITKDVVVTQELQTIMLQAPIPIYGDVDVNSTPSMADIYIDGTKYGQTPLVIENLPVGLHQIRLAREGYLDFTDNITIRENENESLNFSMTKEIQKGTLTTSDNSKYTVNVGKLSFTMIRITGGTFQMGVDENKKERPVHDVTLSSYFFGEREVTQELWEFVMGNNPSYEKDANSPVTHINWNDCQKFIRKLNKMTGLHFRLPTEAEWKFAAGTTPNPYGILIHNGSFWCWCKDWYGPYSPESQQNPQGPKSGRERVIAGGGWSTIKKKEIAIRSSWLPKERLYISLRLALDM